MVDKLYAYNRFSQSGKALAEALNIRRIKHQGSRWRPTRGSVVLNWGSSSIPRELFNATIVNEPVAVGLATDKLRAFQTFSRNAVPCPEYTTEHETAAAWIREGSVVVCRTLTRASSGRGIVLATTEDELVNAPLYTKYFKRREEYRVHVINGEIVDVQRKMRRLDVPDEQVNWHVRNHCNGFVFGRGGVVCPDVVADAALKAVSALSLDFGAVDIGFNETKNTACVFEVNTAPNLEGTTLDKYVQAFSA